VVSSGKLTRSQQAAETRSVFDTSDFANGLEGRPSVPQGERVCEYKWVGRVEYTEAWELQREVARRRALGEVPDTLVLLEHPPVFTTGRRGAGENLRLPEELLGAPLIETDRGGDITFHGPGQLVAYPIIDLREAGLTVVSYVRALEETIIRTLGGYGVEGERVPGMTGVWVGEEKIAAIGVRVGRPAGVAGGWVTGHGLALNVDVDLDWFGRIVPCGIADRGVTSILALTGVSPGVEAVGEALAEEFGAVFARDQRMLSE
jgi:lipoyl(octanoyl) transferase